MDKATYTHSYPFCWRSDTPLIYKAVPSWFVAVQVRTVLRGDRHIHELPLLRMRIHGTSQTP